MFIFLTIIYLNFFSLFQLIPLVILNKFFVSLFCKTWSIDLIQRIICSFSHNILMPKDAVKKGSNPKKTTPQKKEATKSPVATKEKTASKQKNQINGDDKKQNKKRKLEEREDKIVEQENVEQIAEQNESKEEVEEQKVKEQEPVQKKQKTNNSDGKTVLIAQYLRVNNEAIMRTLTKELKLDVA